MDGFFERVAAAADATGDRAATLDDPCQYPSAEIDALHGAGVLAAVVPVAEGGCGFGTAPDGADGAFRMLRSIGRGNLSVGRLIEAHVNALKLITLYGSAGQTARASADARAGHCFALWVTETAAPVRLIDGRLCWSKQFCSGAGYTTRALVTACQPDGGTVLAIVTLDPGTRPAADPIRLQGMREAVTGTMDLTGLTADIVGAPGDYLRQPEFSAGAWRTSAVTLGGLDALVAAVRAGLVARGRAADPHQLVRLGELFAAQETCALWVQRAARIAEQGSGDPGAVAAYVNLARVTVERTVLAALQTAQRALGLGAFIVGSPAERLLRDLATYLRQPAPDETLTEAAAFYTRAGGMPE